MRYPWLDEEESDSEGTPQAQLVLSAAEQSPVPTLLLPPSGGGGGGGGGGDAHMHSNPDEIELPSEGGGGGRGVCMLYMMMIVLY